MTPAVLALEAANQPHRLLHYSRSGSESKYGEEVSAKLGIDPDRVFKTLMAELSDGELEGISGGPHYKDYTPWSGSFRLRRKSQSSRYSLRHFEEGPH